MFLVKQWAKNNTYKRHFNLISVFTVTRVLNLRPLDVLCTEDDSKSIHAITTSIDCCSDNDKDGDRESSLPIHSNVYDEIPVAFIKITMIVLFSKFRFVKKSYKYTYSFKNVVKDAVGNA